jgi:aromatic ring-opening dioxygenase catalytic subunit (LigB family)
LIVASGNLIHNLRNQTLGPDALLAAPTPEHYLPLLYVLGAQLPADAVSFPTEGIDGGSISMLAAQVRLSGCEDVPRRSRSHKNKTARC